MWFSAMDTAHGKKRVSQMSEYKQFFGPVIARIHAVQHISGCPHKDSDEPLRDCDCWCYERQIYRAGLEDGANAYWQDRDSEGKL